MKNYNTYTKAPYLNNINYFRGIAIIFIVFWHCFEVGLSNFSFNNTYLTKFLKQILPGGTIFFVFISGYLFHHVYLKNFKLLVFLQKKIKYILAPYLIFTSLDYIFYLVRLVIAYYEDSNKVIFYTLKLKSLDFVNIFILGHTELNIGLWYIPFILAVFSLSNLYLKFINIEIKKQIYIIGFLMIVSCFIHRSLSNEIISILQNVIYFTPIYLMGIFFSIHKKILDEKKNKNTYTFLFFSLIITILQVAIGELKLLLFDSKIENSVDLMILQKTMFTIFFISFVNKFSEKSCFILNLLANNSFGIFFLHGLYIWLTRAIIYKFQIDFTNTSFLSYLISAVFILLISLISSILIRKLIPHYSRFIIGC